MRKILEKDVQSVIMQYLRLKGFVVIKHNNVGIYDKKRNTYITVGEKGIADLIFCDRQGRFGAVECKRPGGKASPEQLIFLERVRANGGIAILAFSLDDVVKEVH